MTLMHIRGVARAYIHTHTHIASLNAFFMDIMKTPSQQHITCKALTMPSIISGSMRGSSPWILTTTSYFFPSFWSASLQRSVPTLFPRMKKPTLHRDLIATQRAYTISTRFRCHHHIGTKTSTAFSNLIIISRHNYTDTQNQIHRIINLHKCKEISS